jgi:hypothetical protein
MVDVAENQGYVINSIKLARELNIEVANVQKVLENWKDYSYLELFNTFEVTVWYEDNTLNFEDYDGCGFCCDKDRFIELFC